MPFSTAYRGRKAAIPPNVTVIKNNKMDGCKAVFSKISNLTVVDLCGDSSTRLYRILEDKSTAINPKLAQIKNNFVNDMTPTSVKPSAGPNASAKFPDNPK